jgi:uncharacterized protein (TIGR02757 family)
MNLLLSLKSDKNLKNYLDECVERFNRPDFIDNDPIQIPHRFSKRQDIEIAAFWTAMLSWGQRKTIINSATKLMQLMDNAPHDFVVNHQEIDRRHFLNFVHRTFQPTDTLYFLEFFQQFYQKNDSLEDAFAAHLPPSVSTIENALLGFHNAFFSLPVAPQRTKKHIATPASKSTCKRLCMFLRWMVRQDACGVDFGLWQKIKPAQLLMPLDVHVDRHARRLGLLERPKSDWQAVLELTENLRAFDPNDPVKYDFALFGLGVLENKSLVVSRKSLVVSH